MNKSQAEQLKEVVLLGATDPLLMYSTFFSKTCRMGFAPLHRSMSDLIETPHGRLINIQAARGFAKTSFLRMHMGKRIAYRKTKNILYIGASEGHATRSLRWIKSQVEKNRLLSHTFGLMKGSNWRDDEAQIAYTDGSDPVWIKGVGITSSIRGINFDDYRPDLIVLDDVLTDENAATEEQRQKLTQLILGAVKQSLAPRTENPDAKLIMIQTPLDKEDASCQALKSPEWLSGVFPCWTPETVDLPLELRESAWPEREPSEDLRKECQSAIQTGTYSTFAKEKECRLVTGERSKLRLANLRYWDDLGVEKPQHGTIVIAVDPVPPPSEVQIKKNLHDKDYEAVTVTMRWKGNYYLLAYRTSRGHEPIWTAQTVYEFIQMFRPLRVVIEAVAYQRVLAGTVSDYLRRRQIYTEVKPVVDKRSKYNRIIGALMGVTSVGKLYVSRKHVDFIRDYSVYPDVQHDDLLDSVSIGLDELVNPLLEGMDGSFFADEEAEDDFNRPLNVQRGIP